MATNSIYQLRVDDSFMGYERVQKVIEALKTNASLTSIDFSFNQIGDEGARALAEALKTNTSLTSIGLRFNQIDDDDVTAECHARCRANAREWIARVLILLLQRPELRAAVRARDSCAALASRVMATKIEELERSCARECMWSSEQITDLRALVEQKLAEYRDASDEGAAPASKRVKQ